MGMGRLAYACGPRMAWSSRTWARASAARVLGWAVQSGAVRLHVSRVRREQADVVRRVHLHGLARPAVWGGHVMKGCGHVQGLGDGP
jgi:hypothetical protein